MSETESLRRDEQLGTEGLAAAFGAQIDNSLKQLHTALPAIVVSFDAVKQTCVVQPAIQRVFSGTARNLPVCQDCPVVFPQGGGAVMTFPIKAGDEVLLVLAERAIDNWFAAGGPQAPSEYRMHDLSDGFVVPGVRNQKRNLAGFNTAGAELRTDDRATRVTLDLDGTITLLNPNASGVILPNGTVTHKNAKCSSVLGVGGMVTLQNASGSAVIAPDGTVTHKNGAGSTVLTPDGKFTVNAPAGFVVNGAQTNSSTIAAQGNISTPATVSGTTDVVGAGKSLKSHGHTLVTPGGGTSGPPA